MLTFAIRDFRSTDRPFLRRMLEMAAVPTYPELLKLGRISMRERLDAIFDESLAHPDKQIWIAETPDGRAIGMIWLQGSHHPVTEMRDYLILNIAVDPEARGHGVGTALLARARDYCESVGVTRLRLFVAASNAPAVALYRKLGFIDQTREMLLEL